MSSLIKKEYCCCQVFPIYQGVYLIALHSFFQAAFAEGIILTSYYKHENKLIVYITAGCHLSLIPIGILVFWANLYENWRGAGASGILMFVVSILNSSTSSLYFFWFHNFKANSQLDKVFFWRNDDNWITSDDMPFTFWHILSFQLMLLNLLWFYYSRVMCKLGNILKLQQKKESKDTYD